MLKKILNPGFIFASNGKDFENAILKFSLKPEKVLVGKANLFHSGVELKIDGELQLVGARGIEPCIK